MVQGEKLSLIRREALPADPLPDRTQRFPFALVDWADGRWVVVGEPRGAEPVTGIVGTDVRRVLERGRAGGIGSA